MKAFLTFTISILFAACNSSLENTLDLQTQPVNVELVGENFISTSLYERDIAISSNLDEIIYSMGDYRARIRCLVKTEKTENGWSNPEILNISGTFDDIEPFLSGDGDVLYFASNRPVGSDTLRNDYNIWQSKRIETGWSEPEPLPEIINSTGNEFYPSLSQNGNLYFTAMRNGGVGAEDIYVSRFINGKYQHPEVLDTTINSTLYEFNAYINPDETLLIFTSYGRQDDMGGGDLYYSIKNNQGAWQPARNMGTIVNSKNLDYCPFVDETNMNFYFTSERAAKIQNRIDNPDELRKIANQVENGLGNIYRISLEQLNLQ